MNFQKPEDDDPDDETQDVSLDIDDIVKSNKTEDADRPIDAKPPTSAAGTTRAEITAE